LILKPRRTGAAEGPWPPQRVAKHEITKADLILKK